MSVGCRCPPVLCVFIHRTLRYHRIQELDELTTELSGGQESNTPRSVGDPRSFRKAIHSTQRYFVVQSVRLVNIGRLLLWDCHSSLFKNTNALGWVHIIANLMREILTYLRSRPEAFLCVFWSVSGANSAQNLGLNRT